jgi:predicted kinase
MIIVTGAPGAGKTTLSKNLAGKFNLPVINKDEIKELLFFLSISYGSHDFTPNICSGRIYIVNLWEV